MKKIKLVSDGGSLFEVLLSLGSIKGKYYYRNTSPTCIRHRPIRCITPLKCKNVSSTRHHEPSSNAFPFPRIDTVEA